MADWQQVPRMVLPRQQVGVPSGTAIVWLALPFQVVSTGALTDVVIAAWSIVGGAFTEVLQVFGYALLSTPRTILVFVLGLPLRIAVTTMHLLPPSRRWRDVR
ncbi:hypothetical protein [Curtobacterium herbarum]|uniref:Uncharacterized protein n=1 Tax=Curtobacterium herbarum TaxID=150122 RepID=A0ABP4K0D1_9MICO|nr:hypothetical protein [Curtobacterium herbarum]MBM7476200.1 hypothetical protein [Curtobacterium herbarum]MCS6544233.1 hypothetical protein [Curtobacterium herbarum]